MNYEAVLLALYESYTQLGAILSEAMSTERQNNPRINPARSTKKVQAGMGTKESPSRVEVHSEDPKRRKMDWRGRRMDLEARRAGRGQTATGQPASPKKPGMLSILFKKNK